MNTNDKTYCSNELEKEYGPISFGRALWAYRKGEEIRKEEFAQALGISPLSLSDMEKGRCIPTIRRAGDIAKQLGQSVPLWIEFALQDQLRVAGLDYIVAVR